MCEFMNANEGTAFDAFGLFRYEKIPPRTAKWQVGSRTARPVMPSTYSATHVLVGREKIVVAGEPCV
jgi:hypothetical protein